MAPLLLVAAFQANAFAEVGTEGDTSVDASAVYLHSQSQEPWGSESNDTAMNTVFGAAGWDEEHFQTVDTGTGASGLFSPAVKFIFLDGSDHGANALQSFLTAHENALKSFVAAGGHLIVNSAPNEGAGMSYDGHQIFYDDSTAFSRNVIAADPANPIFGGPNIPAGTRYSGTYFGHALIQGADLTALILRTAADTSGGAGDPSAVVLAEYRSSCGITLLGGMTTSNFHHPQPNADNLRANIIDYAAHVASTCTAPDAKTSAASGTGTSSATLNGTVNPHGRDTTYRFEYGASSSYGSQTAVQSAGSDAQTHPGSAAISGLTPGTTYHFHIVATNADGTSDGGDMTFRTASPPPPPPPPQSVIASAPRPTCVVPELGRRTLKQARKLLASSHCKLGKVTVSAAAKRRGKLRVTKSSPGAGTVLPNAARVAVKLGSSARPAAPPKPHFTG